MKRRDDNLPVLSGALLDDDLFVTLAEMCSFCNLPAERMYEMVEEGIAEPVGSDPSHWRFNWMGLYRVQCALRFQRDLGVNIAGAALALDLMDEIDALRTRLKRFER